MPEQTRVSHDARPNAAHLSPIVRPALVLFALLATFFVAPSSEVFAQKKLPSGRIEVSTTPGGNPMFIDGREAGLTTESVRLVDLPPGPHTVEIVFPNGKRWSHIFNIIQGRKECIALNYRPLSVSIPRAPDSPCPYPVNVTAPPTVSDGDIITFAADVAYAGPSALNYTWTISPPSARILSGAGTPTITVDSTGLGKRRVTAILVVDDGSGERNCRQTSQSSTSVLANVPVPVRPARFDEFPSLAFDDDKARLDNFAIELQNNPGARGYVIAYAGRGTRGGTADGLGERARKYLVEARGMDASRVQIVNGGYRERNAYELWLVPTGAEPPMPTPTAGAGDAFSAPRPATNPRRRRPRR